MEFASIIPAITRLVLFVALGAVTLYAVIFGYHWFQYGSSRRTSLSAIIIFVSGAALLLFGMLLSVLAL